MSELDRVTKAFILCGGLGTRLRTVLSDRPKSMAHVAGVPFLQLLIEKLKAEGVRELALGTGYLAEAIETYFGDGSRFGISISYSQENKPLGTGGALRNALPQLADPVLVLNGDSYVEWDLHSMEKLMYEQSADLVMVLQEVPDSARYGSAIVDPNCRITRFIEKGTNCGPGLINAGVYLLRRNIIERLPEDTKISLEQDLFPRLLGEKVYGCITAGTFIDIGIPEDLARAQTLFAARARLD